MEENKNKVYQNFSNLIPVVMSADNNYAPYLAVCIKSLIENSSKNNNYCIYVLYTELSESNQTKIKNLETSNCNIEFIDVTSYYADLDLSNFYYGNLSLASYNRFLIPKIFSDYKKVIYCDCDAVFNADVAEVFNIDIGNKYIGAIKDTFVNYLVLKDSNNEYYYKNILGLEKSENYFQSGFMIMNIPELLKNNFSDNFLLTLKKIEKPKYYDQCILNIVCQNNVYFIPEEWNFMFSVHFIPDYKQFLPKDILQRYMQAHKNPKYIHFCGAAKPWQDPLLDKAEIFWKYARMTDFYEQIIYENIYKKDNTTINNNHLVNNNKSEKIFSIRDSDDKSHKIITIFRIKIKIKKGKQNGQ